MAMIAVAFIVIVTVLAFAGCGGDDDGEVVQMEGSPSPEEGTPAGGTPSAGETPLSGGDDEGGGSGEDGGGDGARDLATAGGDCIPGGGGYLRAELSGEIEDSLDWGNDDTTCDGGLHSSGIGFEIIFSHDYRDEGPLIFRLRIIELEEGETGEDEALAISVSGPAVGIAIFAPLGVPCTVDLTEHSRIGEVDVDGRLYAVAGSVSCTRPLTYLGGTGAEITLSDLEFRGVTLWN